MRSHSHGEFWMLIVANNFWTKKKFFVKDLTAYLGVNKGATNKSKIMTDIHFFPNLHDMTPDSKQC